jgi:4-hydroxy-2-oxoheptanedioate aldolase
MMMIETFAEIVREAKLNGLLTLCRIPDFNMGFVNRVLDAGASGLVLPHIKSRGDALRAVEMV